MMYGRPVWLVISVYHNLLEVIWAVRRRMVLAAELLGLLLKIQRFHPVLAYVTIVSISLHLVLAFGRADLVNLRLIINIPQPDICNAQAQALFVAAEKAALLISVVAYFHFWFVVVGAWVLLIYLQILRFCRTQLVLLLESIVCIFYLLIITRCYGWYLQPQFVWAGARGHYFALVPLRLCGHWHRCLVHRVQIILPTHATLLKILWLCLKIVDYWVVYESALAIAMDTRFQVILKHPLVVLESELNLYWLL